MILGENLPNFFIVNFVYNILDFEHYFIFLMVYKTLNWNFAFISSVTVTFLSLHSNKHF